MQDRNADNDARQRRAKEEAVDAAKETAKSWLTFVNDKVTEKVNEKWNTEPFDTLDEAVAERTKGGWRASWYLVERTETKAVLASKASGRALKKADAGTIAALGLGTLATGGLALPATVGALGYLYAKKVGKKERVYLTLEVGEDGRVYRTSAEMGPA